MDFAAWCSYKYLNGGPGATAGAFVHERHFDSTAPRLSGWWGNDIESRFEMAAEFRPYRGAAGWQVSNHPLLGMVPLKASFAQFAAAGLPALRERSLALTGWLENAARGATRRAHRDPDAARAGGRAARSFRCACAARAAAAAPCSTGMLARGLTCDWREPDVIRLAPAPLYNSYEDCWRAVELIGRQLSA